MARPLTVHEFDACVVGGPLFDRRGLIVAVRDGNPVGYVHAGFGPEADELGPRPLRLSEDMGTVGMLVVEPGVEDAGLEAGLLEAVIDVIRPCDLQLPNGTSFGYYSYHSDPRYIDLLKRMGLPQ